MHSSDAARGFGQDITRKAPGDPNPLIELRGADEVLIVRLTDFQNWIVEYDTPGGFILKDPDAAALQNGAKAVISFFGT
jgi:hypothetical protein